ncbi:hypothetical protein RHGRI_010404 [Rhododendron griersonianum]|uniref:F-box/LRR-repeat protein 15-like leucin rich repeat domain-containing protein n=1 Tax=Rhododendron griersonianum TaxID=479676 RepID=A0AAV6KIQ0_9ERIC|nr:hypothetical protein RHGRI_010404 [Rhododendron griersonianum]
MEERERANEEEGVVWNRETVPRVLEIVSTRLPQRDLISLLLVSPWIHRTLTSHPSLWLVLDFREMNNAGNRLVSTLSQLRYKHVKQISLEFAQDIEDKHFDIIKSKVRIKFQSLVCAVGVMGISMLLLPDNACSDSLQNLESLNLNGCQKISDRGVEAITSICPNLKVFSIYWNVRVTDTGIEHLVKNCKHIVDLNLSGCKNISDKSLQLIADNYQHLECLNLTRCIKLTDGGLCKIFVKCSYLHSLNLYAVSSFTDEAYKKISLLTELKFLDLCGAQNLTDHGLSCIAKCNNLVSLNLTWCVRVTDEGVIPLAEGCTSLEFLSLFGIVGVTDKCLEALSKFCSSTITTLDVNGCIGIKAYEAGEILGRQMSLMHGNMR